jgi:hypothetical protein
MKGNYSVGKTHQQKPNEREKPVNAHEKKTKREKKPMLGKEGERKNPKQSLKVHNPMQSLFPRLCNLSSSSLAILTKIFTGIHMEKKIQNTQWSNQLSQ